MLGRMSRAVCMIWEEVQDPSPLRCSRSRHPIRSSTSQAHQHMRRYRYKQSICILYCAMFGSGACRPRGWNRRCQSCMTGVAVPRTHSTVRLKGERSAFNESEGVLLHCAPLTRLLAQQCFRQRKCREGLAAPRNLLTTCLSHSQWWFLGQSFAPVDHFLLLSQQGVSRRRLSFRLLNRSPFVRFLLFSLFVSVHPAISINALGSDV
ncbi:hypothetical protein GGI35DRAFT_99490 [Trichoderma velutinum]